MKRVLARYGYHLFLVVMACGLILGLSACDDGSTPQAPAPVEHVTEDTTGTFRPYIGSNGKVGFGYDLGGGLVMGTNGKIGFGF
jgi:hypothetical protein